MFTTPLRWRVAANVSLILSVLLLLAAYPLALALPEWWSHENQPVENAQVVLLGLGMVTALIYFGTDSSPARWLGLAAAPVWLVLVGRELSWGAVFFAPTGMTDHGPLFASRALWYKPIVTPAVAALILSCIAIVVVKKLAPLALELAKRRRLPIASLAVVTLSMIVSTAAEGHFGFQLAADSGVAQLVEEIAELAAYLALLASQFFVFAHLGTQETGGG